MNSNDLRTRVENAIHVFIDVDAWNRMREVEAVECQSLRDIMTRWQQSISGQAME
jgi:hypothetical protein